MKCSGTFLFQICLSLVVSTCSCSCKSLDNNIKTEDLEGYYTLLSEQNLIEEEDMELSLGNFLDTMKERFLRKLNLSDAPIEQGKIYPPPFMMELYNTYASNSTGIPQFDVIRSFAVQGVTRLATNGTKSKHSRLLFNVSFPSHEKVTSAELRLFLLADGRLSVHPRTVKATVKVYDVDCNGFKAESHLLGGTEIHAWRSSWAKFDVTKAVQSWVRLGYGENGFLVAVDNGCAPFHEGIGGGGCLDVSASVGDNASAALIVFSDDMGSKRRENKHELKEMILREEEAIGFAWNGGKQLQNEIPEALHPKRERRKAEREYCRKTSLKVNFKDIGWDSWIVAPPEYDAFECRGLCYHPLTDESTPSKHALIQTLINIRNPKKANMACCVPIKLDPITVMYQENGQLTIRYLYEEMKVAECGCR